MPMVSISEAAKLAGISRTHFYRKYLNTGIISISKDKSGKSSIDISELLRVFGTLQKYDENVTECDINLQACNKSEAVLLEKIKGLENLLKAKEEELDSYRDREKALYRILEHKPQKKSWWLFKRLR
jgi:dTDP-4-amino-4,6-dideoxygalactose transaminase